MTRKGDRLGNASAVAGYVRDLPQSRYCMGFCPPTMAIKPRGDMRGFLFVHKIPTTLAAFCTKTLTTGHRRQASYMESYILCQGAGGIVGTVSSPPHMFS